MGTSTQEMIPRDSTKICEEKNNCQLLEILTLSLTRAQATRRRARTPAKPIMAMDSAATQVGVDGTGPGVGTFPVGKGVDTVVVGGRVGERVLDPVPLAISGQAGTKEAPPCPCKYASHLHPMLKYLVSENVPINSIHKKWLANVDVMIRPSVTPAGMMMAVGVTVGNVMYGYSTVGVMETFVDVVLWGMKSSTVVACVEDVTCGNVYGSKVVWGVFMRISGFWKCDVMVIGVEGTGILYKRFGSNVLRMGFAVVVVDDVVCSIRVKCPGNMLCEMLGLCKNGTNVMGVDGTGMWNKRSGSNVWCGYVDVAVECVMVGL
jgi:hypothetical protein